MDEIYETTIYEEDEEFVYPEVEQQELPVQEEEPKKEDTDITKDLIDILKAVTEKKEEVSSGDADPEQKEDEEQPIEVENEVLPQETEIVTSDYTQILEDIKKEVTSGQAAISEQNILLSQYIDDNKPNSPIDNLSVTNLLLVLIFILFLIDLLIKFIRGLF